VPGKSGEQAASADVQPRAAMRSLCGYRDWTMSV